MGPKSDESDHSQDVCSNLIENILNEAFRSIGERTDCCNFGSFENFKIHTFGSEDILNFSCPKKESFEKPKDNFNEETVGVNDSCHPSLANSPEVCILGSTISTSSKQGEGDFQQPTIREAAAFYRLDMQEEETLSCENIDSNKSSPASLAPEPPQNDLEASLLRDISKLSFSSFELRSSNDDLQEPLDHTNATILLENSSQDVEVSPDISQEQDSQEQDSQDSDNDLELQPALRQSRKFCQLNNNNYFLLGAMETDYHRFSNERCVEEDLEVKEEDEQELLSENSEELVNIESDSGMFTDNFTLTKPFIVQMSPSCMVIPSSTSPGSISDEEQTKEKNLIKTVANVEPQKQLTDWEESLEIQVTVTEPDELEEVLDNEDVIDAFGLVQEEDDNAVKQDIREVETRQFWSNTGLITEHKTNPKLRGLIDSPYGLESIQGVTRVEEVVVYEEGAEEFEQTGRYLRKTQSVNKISQSHMHSNEEENTNYLISSCGKTEKTKKKKKLLTRFTNSFTNLFKSKSKTQKS